MWNLRPKATRSIRSRQLLTAWYTISRQIATKCQTFTTSSCKNATRKKKTPESLYQQSYISGSWLAPFIRSIRRSWQQLLYLWTLLHQCLGQRFQKSQNKSVVIQVKELIREAEKKVAFCGPRCRCCTQAFDLKVSCPYPQSSNQLAPDFPLRFFSQGFGNFSLLQTISALQIGFPPCFLIEFRRFFIDWAPSFFPCFLIKFRRFFH